MSSRPTARSALTYRTRLTGVARLPSNDLFAHRLRFRRPGECRLVWYCACKNARPGAEHGVRPYGSAGSQPSNRWRDGAPDDAELDRMTDPAYYDDDDLPDWLA